MDAFMAHLLADVDASVFDLPPSQSPPKKSCSLEAAQSSQQRIRSISPARRSPAAHKRPKLGHASAELRVRTQVKDEPGDDAGSSSCLRTSQSAPTSSTKQIAAESDERYDEKAAARSRKDAIRMAREQAEERGGSFSDQTLASSFAHKSSAAEYREKRGREREAARSYVRAKVLNIGQDNFIPASTLSAAASAPPALISASTVDKMRTRRQVVLNVEERAPLDIRDQNFVRADEHGARRKVYLRDEWLSLAERIRVGDYVHLIGHWSEAFDDFEDAPSVTGNSSSSASAQAGPASQVNGHPVSKPDLAIVEVDEDDDDDMSLWANLDCTLPSSTPTKLPLMILSSSGALDASGHPPSDGATSEALVMGAMLHVVLQSCLTGTALPSTCEGSPSPSGFRMLPSLEMPECFPPTWNGVPPTNFSASFVAEQICAQVDACLEDLTDAGLDTQVAREHLVEAVKPFGEFAFKYLASPEGDIPHDAVAIDSRSESPPRVRIRRVLEVEEDIWSPMYGLKGFVDISVEVEVQETWAKQPPPRQQASGRAVSAVFPNAGLQRNAGNIHRAASGPLPRLAVLLSLWGPSSSAQVG
ncbi:PROTEIN DNA-2, ISOFORM A [Ceraceosorus bombacis]|uniref:PROTEIN DNA-2, ISOFORM A n=1 Tax=Ceraceosorus bombacis TaxID=401625 RepID=A0A0P1BG08_9BASI|nr:PROTEIN DNA-2, ISOFORM A [Ceraceosorus bombacis]